MTSTEATGGTLPAYDGLIADVFDAYLRELVGYEDAPRWAHLPATWRWHEFWDRLGDSLSATPPSAAPQGGRAEVIERACEAFLDVLDPLLRARHEKEWPHGPAFQGWRAQRDKEPAEHAENIEILKPAILAALATDPLPPSIPEGMVLVERTLLRGIFADYVTSERHHPDYVLIPTPSFDALRETFDSAPFPHENGEDRS